MRTFVKRTKITVPQETLFAWHEMPGAFERLTPPFENIRVLSHSGGIKDGATIKVEVKEGLFPIRWELQHQNYRPPHLFQDVQLRGLFKSWSHEHRFLSESENQSVIEDRIEYELPLGFIGDLFGNPIVMGKLNRLFEYRHAITTQDVLLSYTNKEMPPMKILISGASGLIGSALVPFLTAQGHEVVPLTRNKGAISWDPETGDLDVDKIEGFDAVVHLAGESVAQKWTPNAKTRIHNSRIKGTGLLAEGLATLKNPPKVFICASAIGFYGNRGSEILTEKNSPGSGFLSSVCKGWENASTAAAISGIRTVNLRIGIVLSPKGGALAKMLTPFKMGGGGVLGSGKQYMSWISLDDMVNAIYFALQNQNIEGPLNAVAPYPVTNREFTSVLGKVLGRPAVLPVPSFALQLLLGEMAEELLLGGCNVLPEKLTAAGFKFQYPQIEPALRHLLGKN